MGKLPAHKILHLGVSLDEWAVAEKLKGEADSSWYPEPKRKSSRWNWKPTWLFTSHLVCSDPYHGAFGASAQRTFHRDTMIWEYAHCTGEYLAGTKQSQGEHEESRHSLLRHNTSCRVINWQEVEGLREPEGLTLWPRRCEASPDWMVCKRLLWRATLQSAVRRHSSSPARAQDEMEMTCHSILISHCIWECFN